MRGNKIISNNLLNHFAFWFVTVFATPMFIAINNSDDVVMGLATLTMVLAFSSLTLAGMTFSIGQLAHNNFAQRFGLLMAGFALVLAIQCNLVHDLFFYGNFNGQQINFRSDPNAFRFEWYGFLTLVLFITAALQWFRPKGPWIAVLSIASSSLLLIPALPVFNADSRPFVAEENVDPAVFEFSRNGNIIHLVPDGFQSDVVQQVLEQHPDLASQFEGFTLFSNHLGMYQGTGPSIPTILTGQPFNLSAGFHSPEVIADIQRNSYPVQLKKASYRLDYVQISSIHCIEEADSCTIRPFNDMKPRGYLYHRGEGNEHSMRILADLTLFRLLPMWFKEKIYDNGLWYLSDNTLGGSSPWPDTVIREWVEHMQVTNGPPVYKWYHFIGTHIPPHWDAQCNYQRELPRSRENYQAQAYCVLSGIAGLIKKLKKEGIYNDTAIIISGDHGHGIAPIDELYGSQQSALPSGLMGSARPVLMIKQKHNLTPLIYSRVPSSLIDIAPTVLALAGIEHPDAQMSVFNIPVTSNRIRKFIPYSIKDLYTGNPIPHVVYAVGNDVRDSRTWLVEQMSPFQTAPSQYDPVNYRNGKNLVIGVRYNSRQPDKQASWVNGRQLAFLISPARKLVEQGGSAELLFGLHLPKWIQGQKITLSVNGQMVIENQTIEIGKGYWTKVVVDLTGVDLLPENNFVSVQFSHSELPPGIKHFEVATMIQSIRLRMKPASDTSKVSSALP